MALKYLELAMTEAVQRAQNQYYGRAVNIAGAPERDPLTQDEAEFIAARDSFYLGSISGTGWPYIQHRGGPQGFLRVINETTSMKTSRSTACCIFGSDRIMMAAFIASFLAYVS